MRSLYLGHQTSENRSIATVTSQAAWGSETDYVLGQDMGVHVGVPNNVLPRARQAVHTRVELFGAWMTLLGPWTNELGFSKNNPAKQKMPQTIPINRSKLNTANEHPISGSDT